MPEWLAINAAVGAPEILAIILVLTTLVLPVVAGDTALGDYLFRKKACELRFD